MATMGLLGSCPINQKEEKEMKTSRLITKLIAILIFTALLAACGNTTTPPTPTSTPASEEVIEEAADLFVDQPITLNFHGVQLVEDELPSWLSKAIARHETTCDAWPESELTKLICEHISNYSVGSFEVHRLSNEKLEPYITYDSTTRRLFTGETLCDIDKPTVHIETMDNRNVDELKEEEGFDLALKIIAEIQDLDHSPAAAAEAAGVSCYDILWSYLKKGWEGIDEKARESLLTYTATDPASWERCFWTADYAHYVRLGSEEEDKIPTQKIYVDGKYFSILPDAILDQYNLETAEKLWGRNTGSIEYFKPGVFCDKEGTFFSLSKDLQVYTNPWNKGQIEWLPTYFYPAFGRNQVFKLDDQYVVVDKEAKAVRIFTYYDAKGFGYFGANEKAEITLNDPETKVFGEWSPAQKAIDSVYIASPKNKKVWRLEKTGIGYANCDQIIITDESMLIRQDNHLIEAAYKDQPFEGWRNADMEAALTQLTFVEMIWQKSTTETALSEEVKTSSKDGKLELSYGNGEMRITYE